MIDLQNVVKSYGTSVVLPGVDFLVEAGEVVTIVGPSGAGKSTLLRCINMLEVPDSGDVVIDGRRVEYQANRLGKLTFGAQVRLTWLRTVVGMVFQSFNLWQGRTVLQNLTEGPRFVRRVARKEAEEKARAMLAKVGLADKADMYPAQLSGGQQQRVAIARALVMEPKVLLFDEPTSALDPELVGEVLDLMTDLARSGTTMVVVTHEMEFARTVADRVVFMEAGQILEDGPPEEVFARPRLAKFTARMHGSRSEPAARPDAVEAFNARPAGELVELLTRCADIPRWITSVLAGVPYASTSALLEAAGASALDWEPGEVDAAIRHHPRIGGSIPAGDDFSAREQSTVLEAPDEARQALLEANDAYERRFDRVFLIRALGRSEQEILDELARRTQSTAEVEAREVARELREIALLRLEMLLVETADREG